MSGGPRGISKSEPRHPVKEGSFGCWYPQSHSDRKHIRLVAIRGFPEFLSFCSYYAQRDKPKWLQRQTPFRNGEQRQAPGVFVSVCLCSVLPLTKVSTHQRHQNLSVILPCLFNLPSHLSTFMKQSIIPLHWEVKFETFNVTVLLIFVPSPGPLLQTGYEFLKNNLSELSSAILFVWYLH